MNSVVRQLYEQGTDVVMVDTGNSYEGLCEYLGGKYISYTEERPITMNPFRINRAEMNVEKTGFLKNLVLLIWKGSQGTVTKTEDRLIEQVITEYYDTFSTVSTASRRCNGRICVRGCSSTTATVPRSGTRTKQSVPGVSSA